jgi:GTPase SAR1 family protein
MINMYYKDTVGAIVCYDISREDSFRSVQFWIDEMKKNCSSPHGFVMVLAGNKSDLPPEMVRVGQNQAKQMANENGMYWAEVSAKTG